MQSFLRQLSLHPPWVRLLPGNSAFFGPPRRWATVQAYTRRTGSETRMVEPEETISPPPAVLFGEVDPDYLLKTPVRIPEKTVFRLPGAVLYGADAHIVTADDTFLWDTAWHNRRDLSRTFRGCSLYRRKRARPRRRLQGRTAALSSDWSLGGYAHFVADALPRWRLLVAAGYTVDDFDHFVLFAPDSPSVSYLLRAAGLPSDRWVHYNPSCDLECDELVGTTFPGAVPAISPASVAWLRQLVKSRNGDSRIYVSRAGYRRHPANAAEIEAELMRRRWQIVHGDDGTSALDACALARSVVGVEGSNLFNLCFVPPGARVVLLLPGPGMIQYIPFICQAAGHDLAIVAADPGSSPQSPVFPLAAVRSALEWAEAKPAA